MSRKSKSRGQDQAVDMADAAASSSAAWSLVRLRYPKPVRELVDRFAAVGGVSLLDIMLMELAAHEQLAERIKRLERKPKSTTAVAAALHQQGTSRKHLRSLRVLMDPISTPNDGRHPTSEDADSGAERERALQELAETETDPEDVGDDLVN